MAEAEKNNLKALCARCNELEKRVQALEFEREHLLAQVAQEKARADALFVSFPPLSPNAHPPPPLSTELPLRYKLVDALNDTIKRKLPGAHRLVKRAGNRSAS